MTASEQATKTSAVEDNPWGTSKMPRDDTGGGAARRALSDAGPVPDEHRPPLGHEGARQLGSVPSSSQEGAGHPGAALPAEPAGMAGVVHGLDRAVDQWYDQFRGIGPLDTAAKAITGLGDHGLIWALVSGWRGRRRGPERTHAVQALAVAGIESSLVNATLKTVIDRSRPDSADLDVTSGGLPVRSPKTSSFPSGHTLAAFCSATVLSRSGHRGSNALLFTSASLIGASRVHLGAHHASDVIGGAAIGFTIGLVGRRLL